MSNSNGVIKCPHCNKIFFDSGTNKCPFCKNDLNPVLDIFNNIFGGLFNNKK